MPPPFEDDVVSPELALVDATLAARAREALPPRAGRRRLAVVLLGVTVVPSPVARTSRRAAAPALTLLAVTAASLVLAAVTGGEQAKGESPAQSAASAPGPAPVAAPASAHTAKARATTSRRPADDVEAGTPRGARRSASSAEVSAPSALRALTGISVGAATTRHAAISPTTLVWPGSTHGSAYELELVRNGSVIFTAKPSAPWVVLPRSWSREGVTYVIQPEDQAYVWAVVDGRRTAAPVVDGALALDLTLVERFVELTTIRGHPRAQG